MVQLIEAAEHAGKDAEGSDIRGAARALRDFARLASWVLPIHGVFVPNNNDVAVIIQRIAKEHLDWEGAHSEVRAALSAVQTFELRDPIETAENHLRAVSDEAYFYAGLAFGVTLAEFGSGSSRVG
jgi:hypothetical protein